jgi:hypothetical protein
MPNESTTDGSNFTCFHAGPMDQWNDYCLEPPHAPIKMQGKFFLRNLLQAKEYLERMHQLRFRCVCQDCQR